jgi:adenylate cyclase
VSSIDALVDWLIDGAPGATSSPDVVGRVGADLRAAGVPLDRLLGYVTTLHPSIAGRWFNWSAHKPVQVGELPHGIFDSERFTNSPIGKVVLDKVEHRARLTVEAERQVYPVLEELWGEGYTDYLAVPMMFTTGAPHVITYATRSAAGFSDADLDALRRVIRPLARIAEILAQRRVATTLLDTYVGRKSGDRILRGRIRRGDFETLRAVIWFSDLRGFTELSTRATTREVIETLNGVFDCQVPSIEKHGGEVLKFMGDGLLAIFPFGEGYDPAAVADRALEAAEEALAAMAALAPLRIGLALHVGELAYGNIGSAHRLDFTAIGPAVNLASRLEGLTSKLGRPLVISEELARLTTRASEELGTFELKGIATPARVFAPERRS